MLINQSFDIDQPVDQVRAKESGASGDQNALAARIIAAHSPADPRKHVLPLKGKWLSVDLAEVQPLGCDGPRDLCLDGAMAD